MKNSPGSIVLLLFGIFLLTSYFSGRLDWLFRLKADVTDAARGGAASPPPSASAVVGAGLAGAPLKRPRLEPARLVLA